MCIVVHITCRISRFQDGGSLNNYITIFLAEGIWKVHIFRHLFVYFQTSVYMLGEFHKNRNNSTVFAGLMQLIWIFSYHSIVGNLWLITFLLLSSHHPCVKWDRNPRNSVTVLKHFDKLRQKLLVNNGSRHFLYSPFISKQGIIRIKWWFWLATINSLFSPKRGFNCLLTNE